MLYRFSHKTGTYGVSIKEENDNQVLVQVEQVIKHPKQGDLHNPGKVEGVFFHERLALSHYEKRYATRSKLREFNVEEMKYEESLQQAITQFNINKNFSRHFSRVSSYLISSGKSLSVSTIDVFQNNMIHV
ncbi:sporulation phosphorelay system protein KapB [Staphylococcus devriesei]|uniref:Kinase n=1 Tax=Staphylococcus devriesei TaxID=586733 RepID=A0ABX5I0M0_9STAP|nr:sporulation phosphorelay system protein KapB [Staphylococcus devriesei]MCE5096477.1 kinase [Staphylococcus devriesei]PNZ88505.1 kinase [Staphylococcus devriesei]PTF13339.1 kinase [Staphylococcus devriesei]PTF20287.1 kinase [Staphylococcus devriesei]SUM04082.1 kinase-associated protein B [Staphylococcus devriesei]